MADTTNPRETPVLAGMYVTHNGTTWQVARIISGGTTYAGMTPRPSTYVLHQVGADGYTELRGPSAADLPLAPGCAPCERPDGHAACAALGHHQGPRPMAQPVRVPPATSDSCSCGDYRTCGSCMREHAMGRRLNRSTGRWSA